jgi:hypothetical protein
MRLKKSSDFIRKGRRRKLREKRCHGISSDILILFLLSQLYHNFLNLFLLLELLAACLGRERKLREGRIEKHYNNNGCGK